MFTNKEIKRTALMEERFRKFQYFLNNDFFKRENNKHFDDEYYFQRCKGKFDGVIMINETPVMYLNFLERRFEILTIHNDVVNLATNNFTELQYKYKNSIIDKYRFAILRIHRDIERGKIALSEENLKKAMYDISFYTSSSLTCSRLFFKAFQEFFEEEFRKDCNVTKISIEKDVMQVALFKINSELFGEEEINTNKIIFNYLYKRYLKVYL